MNSRVLYELAEYLVSGWRLAHPDGRPIPAADGVLDEALQEAAHVLPLRFRNELNFANTRVGRRCHELPDILWCAQANMLVSLVGPSYKDAAVQISEGTARRILRRRGHDAAEAARFGALLGQSLRRPADAGAPGPSVATERRTVNGGTQLEFPSSTPSKSA